MRRRLRYRELSLVEYAAAPAMKAIIAADARLVRFWMMIISWADRFVERGAISGAAFILSAIAGIMFVLVVATQRPELYYSRNDIIKTCAGISLTVMILRFICGHRARVLENLSVEDQKEKMFLLQPFRTSALAILSAISALGISCIGKYYAGPWYTDGYFFIAVSVVFSILGLYIHSAETYLNIADKICEEKTSQIKELTGAKQYS